MILDFSKEGLSLPGWDESYSKDELVGLLKLECLVLSGCGIHNSHAVNSLAGLGKRIYAKTHLR